MNARLFNSSLSLSTLNSHIHQLPHEIPTPPLRRFRCRSILHAADGPLKEKALALSASNKDSVLFLSAVVEIEVTAGDNPARKEERKVEMLGTVIGNDGLIVVALSSLDVASTIDGRTVNGPQGPVKLSAKGVTKEVKILMPDGSEVEAKVAFKDTDLDLGFIRPEKPDGVKLTPIDTANNAPMGMLDDVIVLGRLGKDLNRQPVVMTTEVVSPRDQAADLWENRFAVARHAGFQQGRQISRNGHQPFQFEGRQ